MLCTIFNQSDYMLHDRDHRLEITSDTLITSVRCEPRDIKSLLGWTRTESRSLDSGHDVTCVPGRDM